MKVKYFIANILLFGYIYFIDSKISKQENSIKMVRKLTFTNDIFISNCSTGGPDLYL
jgi:hypothetical protein